LGYARTVWEGGGELGGVGLRGDLEVGIELNVLEGLGDEVGFLVGVFDLTGKRWCFWVIGLEGKVCGAGERVSFGGDGALDFQKGVEGDVDIDGFANGV